VRQGRHNCGAYEVRTTTKGKVKVQAVQVEIVPRETGTEYRTGLSTIIRHRSQVTIHPCAFKALRGSLFRCLDVWMSGCLGIWVFGYFAVWLFRCLDVSWFRGFVSFLLAISSKLNAKDGFLIWRLY
jgi:hypothetical protein